jgi:hypothetical protein
MNLQNRPPIFVPPEHCAEVEKLSKAALMDMVWDYATQIGLGAPVEEFRKRREIILMHRKQNK